MNVGQEPNSIVVPSLPCNTVYDNDTDIYGYPVDQTQTCGCSTCESNCTPVDWSQIIKSKSIFDGISTSAIYLIIFLMITTFSANLFNYFKGKKQRHNRSDSIDSYDRIKFDLIK